MNSSKTAPKVEPARHWINDEWRRIHRYGTDQRERPSQDRLRRRQGPVQALRRARMPLDQLDWAAEMYVANSVVEKHPVEAVR